MALRWMPIGFNPLYQLPVNENFLVEADASQCVILSFPWLMTASVNYPSMKIRPRKEHASSISWRLFVKWFDLPVLDSLSDIPA